MDLLSQALDLNTRYDIPGDVVGRYILSECLWKIVNDVFDEYPILCVNRVGIYAYKGVMYHTDIDVTSMLISIYPDA